MDPTARMLLVLAATLLALAALLAAGLLLARDRERRRTRAAIDRLLHTTVESVPLDEDEAPPAASDAGTDGGRRALPARWLEHALGRWLVADEDRRLIQQCGYPAVPAQLALLGARLVLTPLLPLALWLLLPGVVAGGFGTLALAVAVGTGFMAPKWWIVRRAAARRRRVEDELPLLVDLLRLLQGVGLGIDQSLQVIAEEFDTVLRVLGPELVLADRQYRQGRSREQSLQRLATLHGNDALAALVALIVQTDRHGGPVQEPLRQFGERLREARRAGMKARIGRITVQMTAVMVTTLLPALVIVTAGPGFLAIIRALGRIGT